MVIFMCMGHIYQIRNITNDAVYIGSVLKREPIKRWFNHRRDLRGNYHHSPHLQRAWNKYGEHNFVFEVLETDVKDVLVREQWHLDNRRNNFPPRLNYNVCWVAGNCQGRKWSKAMRQKLSLAHIGQKQTPESIAKQIATWTGKCKVPYSFTSPDGKIFNDVRNLRAFARQHNLGPNGRALTLLHRGKLHCFKGWTKTGVSLIRFQLESPSGIIEQGAFLKPMCISNNINYKMIHKYCIKMGKPYRGWMAKQLT